MSQSEVNASDYFSWTADAEHTHAQLAYGERLLKDDCRLDKKAEER
jgi:hypothetical protein